uniref:GPS domain-containing protein n=1 Tax=Mucochytrium quahogii TaxID=96639 RepID=A0A7S2WBC7_9STRA
MDPVSLLTGDAVLNIPDNTEEIILQPKGFVSRFSTLLPTSNGTLVVAVRVFDQLGAFGEAAQRVVVEEGTQIASRHETLRDMLMNPVCDLGLLEALQISNGEHLTQALQVLERILLKCRDEVNATNTFVGFVRSLNVNRTLKVYDRELAFGKVFLTNSIAYWMGRVLAAKQFDSSLNMYFGHHISRGQVSRTVPEEIGARLTVDKLFSLTTARSQFDRGVRRRFENFELEQAGGDVLDARVLEWAENPHGGNQTLSSRVMEFTLSDPDTGSVRMFNNKESPLLFEAIQRVPIHENDTIECGFFNVTTRKWSTNGCWLFKEDDVAVVCACNHTTDFVTWVKTRDTLVDVIRGDGFGNSLADSWYVIVVLFFILSICSGLILAGILLDSRDGANYRRAVLLFLFFERQQKRVAFDRLKTALKQHSLNRNAPSTETSGYRNTSYTDRGAWYHLKLRSRFLSYFFQYDAVFNRLHRAMIMSCVILGKLFTSALFFHFTSKPLYDIVDRLLIVLINTIVFGAFVVCATFVLLRVPPVCGRQRKFNADLKRKCKNQRVIDFQSNPCEPTLLVVESTKEQHEAKTVHQHRTKIDQLLYLFADKPEGKITLWPGWTWYVAYTILGMWCIFCCYFILSWGFVSGNAVVVDWLPTMMLSLFLSLFVFDPMLHLSRRWATRQYQERNPVPRVDNGCYYFEKIEQKNRCDKTVSFIIED